MGKKSRRLGRPTLGNVSRNPISLREESSGIKQSRGSCNDIQFRNHQLLKTHALWASREACIPPVAAYFGMQLAALGERLAIPPEPSLISCQRCETILHPGINCTVRIEKNKAKSKRRRKKLGQFTENNVVIRCDYCSHKNIKRGTPKGYMKEICPLSAEKSMELKHADQKIQIRTKLEKDTTQNDFNAPTIVDTAQNDSNAPTTAESEDVSPMTPMISHFESPATPVLRTAPTLLEAKKRKRKKPASKTNSEPEDGSAKAATDAVGGTSAKRKRKSWTSLKEIAENREQLSNRNITDLKFPIFI